MSIARTISRNKSRQPVARLLTLLVIGVTAAVAQADPVVYTQAYDGVNALTSQNDPTGGYGNCCLMYDDFTLAGDTTITDVHWTGGYFSGSSEPGERATAWLVQFWNDNAGVPGTLAQTAAFIPGLANETFLGGYGSVSAYTYDIDLTSPFQALAGTKYWLSVQPTVGFPPAWGWGTGTGGDGLSYQRFFDTNTVWEYDLAFDLTGRAANGQIPEPATLALLGLGLAGLGLSRRRRQQS